MTIFRNKDILTNITTTQKSTDETNQDLRWLLNPITAAFVGREDTGIEKRVTWR